MEVSILLIKCHTARQWQVTHLSVFLSSLSSFVCRHLLLLQWICLSVLSWPIGHWEHRSRYCTLRSGCNYINWSLKRKEQCSWTDFAYSVESLGKLSILIPRSHLECLSWCWKLPHQLSYTSFLPSSVGRTHPLINRFLRENMLETFYVLHVLH